MVGTVNAKLYRFPTKETAADHAVGELLEAVDLNGDTRLMSAVDDGGAAVAVHAGRLCFWLPPEDAADLAASLLKSAASIRRRNESK